MKGSLRSGLSPTNAPPPQKLQHLRRVDSVLEAVASKTEKNQKGEAPESSLSVSQKEQCFSSVQAGVQPEHSVISLGQNGSTNMTKRSSQSVSTDQHWTQTLPTTDFLSPTIAVPPQDEKPKSRNDISVTVLEKMHHEDSLPLERSTQPTTDARVHEETVSTQRFPGSRSSGALFRVPSTVLQTFLPDEGHQSSKPSSRVSAGASREENPEKANLHKGICFFLSCTGSSSIPSARNLKEGGHDSVFFFSSRFLRCSSSVICSWPSSLLSSLSFFSFSFTCQHFCSCDCCFPGCHPDILCLPRTSS